MQRSYSRGVASVEIVVPMEEATVEALTEAVVVSLLGVSRGLAVVMSTRSLGMWTKISGFFERGR